MTQLPNHIKKIHLALLETTTKASPYVRHEDIFKATSNRETVRYRNLKTSQTEPDRVAAPEAKSLCVAWTLSHSKTDWTSCSAWAHTIWMPSQLPQFQTSHTVYFSTFRGERSLGRWFKSCFLSLSVSQSVSWRCPACQLHSLEMNMCQTPASNTLSYCLMHLFSFLSQFKCPTSVLHYHNNLVSLKTKKAIHAGLYTITWGSKDKLRVHFITSEYEITDRWTILWVSTNTKKRKQCFFIRIQSLG